MHNDFVIVGPPDDPAGIAGATTAVEAMALIAESGAIFVSRADESGTNTRSSSCWTPPESRRAGTGTRRPGRAWARP